MEKQFSALLLAGLPALTKSRINWGQHMGDARTPYIVLSVISMIEGHTQQGPDGLESYRVQVDVYAPDFGQAREIGGAVKALLNGHRDGGFRLITFDGLRLTREGGANAGEAIYRASLDFFTHWRQPNG